MQRGVRQGDPLSTLLFNLVLNEVLEDVRATWDRRGYGTNVGKVGSDVRLTHVAFADDCTLVARSWLSLKRMILTFRDSLAARGMCLHPTKCKVQTNDDTWGKRGTVELADNFSVEILAGGAPIIVLGTALTMQNSTQFEVRNRISAGWRLFWSMKRLLLNSNASVKRRLKLFDATVGSCVLWCAQSWAPRVEELRLLISTRRAMLRRIVRTPRTPDSDYITWFRDATHKAEHVANQARIRDWAQAHHEMKWSWAGHVSRRPPSSWVWKTTTWRDSYWQALVHGCASRPLRPSRRRWLRWEDPLQRYCAEEALGDWTSFANDRGAWSERLRMFSSWASTG